LSSVLEEAHRAQYSTQYRCSYKPVRVLASSSVNFTVEKRKINFVQSEYEFDLLSVGPTAQKRQVQAGFTIYRALYVLSKPLRTPIWSNSLLVSNRTINRSLNSDHDLYAPGWCVIAGQKVGIQLEMCLNQLLSLNREHHLLIYSDIGQWWFGVSDRFANRSR
jgi:hypothetical protein